jgi:hypothetical protein
VPGERLVFADADQAVTAAVPEVTGSYDLATNVLYGRGVPASEVKLVVWNPYFPEYAQPTAVVDGGGSWRLDPGITLHPASHFYVNQDLESGDQVFYCLQIPALHVEVGSPLAIVEGLWDVRAQIELWRAGRAAAGTAGVADFDGGLELVLRDGDGRPVGVAAGDQLVAGLDGLTRTVGVAPLAAMVAPDGMLTGEAAPGAEVVLDSRLPLASVVAGPTGVFSFDVSSLTAGGWARAGERFQVYTLVGFGDHVRVQFRGPEVVAQLGEALVAGRTVAHAPFRLVRSHAGRADEAVGGRAAFDGRLTVTLDEPVEALDTLVLSTGPVTAQVAVPALTATYDPRTAELRGTGPAFTVLDLDVYVRAGRFPERMFATTDETGTWSLELLTGRRDQPVVAPWDVSRFVLRHRVESGAVSLEVGGPYGRAGRAWLPAANR